MIGKLKGIIDTIGEDFLLIDVNGVGYEVYCSSLTLRSIGSVGDACILAIETHVRETEIKLFGFSNETERVWFRKLQSVQGVGAKVALAILGTLTPTDLTNAITLQDKAMVSQAPGVGPKVAARIVSELKDKVVAPQIIEAAALQSNGAQRAGSKGTSPAADAVSALTNLGYQPTEASLAVAAAFAESGEGTSVEELIRLGLKELAG